MQVRTHMTLLTRTYVLFVFLNSTVESRRGFLPDRHLHFGLRYLLGGIDDFGLWDCWSFVCHVCSSSWHCHSGCLAGNNWLHGCFVDYLCSRCCLHRDTWCMARLITRLITRLTARLNRLTMAGLRDRYRYVKRSSQRVVVFVFEVQSRRRCFLYSSGRFAFGS
jgi:hypothetical protein